MAIFVDDPIDLAFADDGDLAVTSDLSLTAGLQAVEQGIRLRVEAIKGEWFLNLAFGVPYFEDILGQKFDQNKVHAAFRNAIMSAPGVLSVLELSASFSYSTRVLLVTWRVNTQFGDTTGQQQLEI
jgi:hypothetical protein